MSRILYYHQQSNFSRKIRILLAEKKIDYELKEIDLSKEKPSFFLEISPIGKVPVFVDEDGPIVWDSTLIAEYIDETYPDPSFYPSSFIKRLECRKWEELADTLGDSIIRLWVLNKTNNLNPTPYQFSLEQSINRLLKIFDQQLSQSAYLLGGETWTIADIATLCSLGYYNLRFNEAWELEYYHLKKWFNKLHEHESVYSTIPQKISSKL